MAVGYPKDKTSVDNVVGELTQSFNRNFRRAVQLKTELDSVTDGQLTAAGYSTNEVTALRTLAADLVQLNGIFTGASNLTNAKDFRTSLRVAWGVLGDF